MRLQHTFCGGDARLTIVSRSIILVIHTTSVVMPLSLTALISSCSNNGFGGNSRLHYISHHMVAAWLSSLSVVLSVVWLGLALSQETNHVEYPLHNFSAANLDGTGKSAYHKLA